MNEGEEIHNDPEAIEELLTRGVVEVLPKDLLLEKLSSGLRLRVKLGIDPTSKDIHIGRAVQLLKLRDFQKLGHQVVLIVGDATGVIGDTSDKENERPMLGAEAVMENAKGYFEQIGKLLDMSRVEFRRNSEWLNALTYKEIGEQADQFSVADFIARENIARRLSGGTRVSLREVLYPLMQGYDSVAIRSDVEIGGTDQRFNLLAGRTLQEFYGQTPQAILMTNLLEGLDGRKMSSSWGNTVNLTDMPHEMYGKIMSLKDELTELYLLTATRVPLREIKGIMTLHPKEAKMRLAYEIVALYHGGEAADGARKNFENVFSKGEIPDAIESVKVPLGTPLMEVLLKKGVVTSKNDYRRLLAEGAISDMESLKKIEDVDYVLKNHFVVRVGKKRFLKIDVE